MQDFEIAASEFTAKARDTVHAMSDHIQHCNFTVMFCVVIFGTVILCTNCSCIFTSSEFYLLNNLQYSHCETVKDN